MVDNNLSESFNAWVDEYRYLPIIRMVDGIRLKLMTKWSESERNVFKWRGNFCPKCLLLFETNKVLSSGCSLHFNGDDGYEIVDGEERHTVFIHKKQCTCRGWDLIGIPCQHAIAALYHAKVDPLTEISRYYHKETYLSSYRTKFQPVRGKIFWGIDRFQPMEPPPICSLLGRPKLKRSRTNESTRRRNVGIAQQLSQRSTQQVSPLEVSDLPPSPPQKLRRIGSRLTCIICCKEGHNRATCKNRQQPEGSQPPTGTQRSTKKRGSQPPTEDATTGTPQLEATQSPPNSRGGKAFYRRQEHIGFGIHTATESSRAVYNPGLASQVVINEGTGQQDSQHDEDVETRMAIPNEMELRLSMAATINTSTRKVQILKDPSTPPTPTLPFHTTKTQVEWRTNNYNIPTSVTVKQKEEHSQYRLLGISATWATYFGIGCMKSVYATKTLPFFSVGLFCYDV